MSKWVTQGLKTGIVTTRYPAQAEVAPGVSPGLPQGGACDDDTGAMLETACPTGAITRSGVGVAVDRGRCVHCFRCARADSGQAQWDKGYEWVSAGNDGPALENVFRRSLHIRVIDAGGCGACLNEVKLLNNPYYNMHRLGFFITPTPRQADVLLVVGPVTDHMKTPLIKAYDAMPAPKRVIAVGACALSGGVFSPSFATCDGVANVLPVDVQIPGCPPPPLALIHALIALSGRTALRRDDEVPAARGGISI